MLISKVRAHRRKPVPICGRPPSRKDLAARLVWSNAVICPAFVVRSYDRWPRWGTRIGSQTWAAMSEHRWAPRVVPILGSTDHHLAVAVLSSANCVVRAVIRARRSPPRSVAAVTTRQIDRPQFLEIELADRFELLGEPRSFEIGRQSLPRRRPGLSNQLRYCSCTATSVATAVAHRSVRDRGLAGRCPRAPLSGAGAAGIDKA